MSYITIDNVYAVMATAAEQAIDLMHQRARRGRDTDTWREAFRRHEAREVAEGGHHEITTIRAARAADHELEIEWPETSGFHRQVFERRALGRLFASGQTAVQVLDVLELGADPAPVERRINAEVDCLPAIDPADLL